MESVITESLGIDPWVFQFVVLPILIFSARIMDVSISTLRIIYMLHGKKLLSTLLGFFESFVWLLAISQIFQNIGSWPTYLAYSSGFASGVLVGMLIEEKLAIGRVVVRVITAKPAENLIKYLTANGYRYSNVVAHSNDGEVNILFTVIKREFLQSTMEIIKRFNEKAFYTVEGVRQVSDDDVVDERGFLFTRIRRINVRR